MVGWHRQLSGQDSEQDPEDGERQGSLPCCSPRGHKTSDMSERLYDNNPPLYGLHFFHPPAAIDI